MRVHYIQPDAASSLTKSRIVLEKLLFMVYTVEMGQEPRKPLLGEMLADNQFTRRIERRILSRMNSVRDMGNLGPHGEPVQPNDGSRVLDDLCEILNWRRILDLTEPKSMEGRAIQSDPGDALLTDHFFWYRKESRKSTAA